MTYFQNENNELHKISYIRPAMIFFFCVRKRFFFFYLLYFCIRYYSGFFPNNIRDIANFKGEGNPLYSLKCFSYLDVRPKRAKI